MSPSYADPRALIQAALAKSDIPSVLVLTDPTKQAPYVHVIHVSGQTGPVDRMDTFRLDVVTRLESGEGFEAARTHLENITTALTVGYHDTTAGYIDRIELDEVTQPATSPLFPGPYTLATLRGRMWTRPTH
ncbi:hypothetical protein H8R18_01300 [Nanchangia anserum]|uniref:Uncharacterized protein n=1 Tax=Nanchangia anserum TaxID=2692125 RepID=A0A8I0KUM9_9ACTO|nr:hypothetical protein [Nanchangia anserum]MBD3689873.1 hypothetical protein [Nanchangia anserum]QOX82041.1 hypothetical protein H8R18_01300 [Nanchangia anserum]